MRDSKFISNSQFLLQYLSALDSPGADDSLFEPAGILRAEVSTHAELPPRVRTAGAAFS